MLTDLTFDLAASGRTVHVVTSRQRYDRQEAALPAQETVHGVVVHRVWTSRRGRAGLLGRLLDYLTFYLCAAFRLWRLARRGDIIVAKTDPPMLSVIAAPVARFRGSHLVNWLQDIFPEVASALGVGRGALAQAPHRWLRRIRDRSLHAADRNVVLGRRMAARLTDIGIPASKIREIPNWADGAEVRPVAHEENPLRGAWRLSGKFVVGYSGNLGRAHDYATMLDAIERLERSNGTGPDSAYSSENPAVLPTGADIVWLFIGGGALFQAFRQTVEGRGLTSVRFAPYQDREQLSLSLSAADVHLVSLRPALEGLIVPSKIYGIAAVARPIIFIGDKDGEVGQLLDRHDCGLTVAEGDGAGLAQAVVSLFGDIERCARLGANGRHMLDTEFDRAHAVARWQALLDEVAPGGPDRDAAT